MDYVVRVAARAVNCDLRRYDNGLALTSPFAAVLLALGAARLNPGFPVAPHGSGRRIDAKALAHVRRAKFPSNQPIGNRTAITRQPWFLTVFLGER